MTEDILLVERRGGTVLLRLNRPDKRNALNRDLVRRIHDAAIEAAADPSVRAIVITGNETAFCAGADLGQVEGEERTTWTQLRDRASRPTVGILERIGVPVIAAVAGWAVGGGCELAMACDLRIAAENARFGLPEIKVGIIPGFGGTQRLPRLVGMTKAKEMVFLGEPVDAREAHRIGLVNAVVPTGSEVDEALALAAKLAERPPLSIRMAKLAMNLGRELALDEALELEGLASAAIFGTEDQKEGVRAFLEKRPPRFEGR